MADLKITIGADLSSAIAQVQKLVVAVDDLGVTGAKASSVADMLAKIPASLKPINPAAMTALSDAVKRLKADLSATTGARALPDALVAIPPAAQKATAAIAAIRPATAQTGATLTDFSRILQDAPFGFIGIQNNIGPLVDSFGRLRASTGTTGGALRALVSGIGGAGGLGLAVSAITAAVTFASIGFDRWVPKIKDAKTETGELAKSSASIVTSLAEETSRIAILVGAIQQDTLSKRQRNGAINELKQLNPDYFGQLDTEKSKIDQVSAAYSAYSANLREQFRTKALSKQLDELFNKKLQLEIALDPKSATANDPALNSVRNAIQNQINQLGGLSILPKGAIADVSKLTDAQQKVLTLQAKLNSVTDVRVFDTTGTAKELSDVNKQIDGLITRITASGNADIKIPGTTPKETDALKQAIQNLEAYRDKVGLTNGEFAKLVSLREQLVRRDQSKLGLDAGQLAKEVTAIRNSNEQLEARKKALDEIAKSVKLVQSEAVEALSLDVRIALNDQTTGKIDLSQTQRTLDQIAAAANLRLPLTIALAPDVQERIRSQVGALPLSKLPLLVETPKGNLKALVSGINTTLALERLVLPGVDDDKLKKSLDRAFFDTQRLMADIGQTIQGTLQNVIIGAAEAIGSAIAGGDLSSVFSSIGLVLAEGMQNIGKAMIVYGAGLEALKKAITNPTAAIAAGVGLVVAGAALKSALSQRKFAEGGIVTGPTNALIGEAGQPEVVFPLNQLNKFVGSMAGQSQQGGFVAETRLQATDIILMIRRELNRSGTTLR